MEIIKLEFEKNENFTTNLTDQGNIDQLIKYIFPIIERNEGWGTGDLTKEEFLKHPQSFQNHIDASVWDNVHVMIVNKEPVALLEFGQTNISDDSKKRNVLFTKLINGEIEAEMSEFSALVNKTINNSIIPQIVEFIKPKQIYTSVGVVLRPDLQNKKTGYSEILYKKVSDGLVFGWTSNPIIVRQRRKLFKNTLYFPPYGEFPNSIEETAVSLYVFADRLARDTKEVDGLEFGAMYSPYFVEERGSEYLEITIKMKDLGKISNLDEKRIKYVLSKNSCAGAIVSWN